MKKKVLFALIALFSFVSVWAAGPGLTGLRDNVPENVYVIGDGLPGASVGQISFLDINQAPVTEITTVGWYFAKITEGEVVTIIPFQAWMEAPYDYIDSEASFNASVAATSPSNGALSLYYQDVANQGAGIYQDFTTGDNTGEPSWMKAAQWGAPKHNSGLGFPWIAPVVPSTLEGEYQCAILYQQQVEEDMYELVERYPWRTSARLFGTNRKYGIVSINDPDDGFGPTGMVVLEDGATSGTQTVYVNTPERHTDPTEWFDYTDTQIDALNFDKTKLGVFFIPAQYDETPVWYDWYLSPTSSQYTSENQYSDLVNQYVRVFAGTGSSPDLVETGEYTVKVYNSAACATEVTEVKNVGSYFVKVFIGEGNNMRQIGASELGQGIKEFKITAYTLTLGSSVAYKQLGDPDPAPAYSLLYDNAMSTEAANLVINGLKLVRQVDPVLQRVPTIADDKVGSQWKYYIDMNEAYIEGVGDFAEVAANYRIGTSSVDGILVVTKKLVNNDQFTVTVADEDLVYDGQEKRPTVKVIYNNPAAGIENKDVTGQFDIEYQNNINADAEGTNSGTDAAPMYAWINGEEATTNAYVAVTPKAASDYTESIMLAGQEQTGKINKKYFKIKQRNISEADIAEIPAVIFNDAGQTPEPKVTYDNGTDEGLTLVKGEDFNYSYDCNTYVTDEEYVTKATITAVMTEAKYSGNWFGTQDKNFTINPFVFTLLPQDGDKPYLDPDPDWTDPDWAKAQLIARPSAEMVDADGNALTFPGNPVYNLLKDGWTISRAVGEFIAVYDINIKNAELKESNPASVSDPAHNYVMTVETGTFEIKKAAEYYASSKFVTREFRSGDNTIPFVDEDNNADGNAFYLYRRTVVDQEVTYEPIPETDDLYLEIKASGRISGNQRVAQNPALQPANSPFAIEPIIDNGDDEVQYEYEIAVLNREYFQHQDDDEGFFDLTPRKVTIMADNLTSVFGEDYKDLTYKVYDGHITRDEVTEETEESEVQLVTNGAYAAHTIAYFNGLSCGIVDAVNAAEKPLTENVEADIVVSTAGSQGAQTLAQRNPNYDIQFVNGTYTVTPSTNQYFVYVELTKNYGDDEWEKNVTWTFGTSKETAEPIDGDNPVTDEEIDVNWGEDGEPTEVDEYPLTGKITYPEGYDVIGGYPVNYDGLATISVAGEVVITVKNLGAQYPVPPTLSFDNKRVSVTGATFAQIAANGDFVLTYTKPEVGFIKKGATVQVEFNGKAFGTPEGQVVSADDWAWVANYTKVTVKSGKVMVTAPEDITLDIVAFNKANYQAAYDDDAEINDELIRDYAGTVVKSVTIKCSEQGTEAAEANQYEIKGDQWYSMVLPFDATVRDIQSLFNGFVGVDQLNKDNVANKASEIRFTYTTKNVLANNPFIAKTDQNFVFKPVKIEREGIEIKYPENEDGTAGEIAIEDGNGNKFIGTYNAFFAPDDDTKLDDKGREITSYYDLVTLGSGSISPASPGAYVRPLGAYIKVAEDVDNAHAPLRIVIEEADGTTTVINGVDADAEVAYGEGWYTINGVKLEGEPATSGTYIFNGKKVFIQK